MWWKVNVLWDNVIQRKEGKSDVIWKAEQEAYTRGEG